MYDKLMKILNSYPDGISVWRYPDVALELEEFFEEYIKNLEKEG